MAKVPTICVTDIEDESGDVFTINKEDFDSEKHQIARRGLEIESAEDTSDGDDETEEEEEEEA